MAEDIKKTIAEKLLESLPTLLSVAGIALIVIGLSGGITYKSVLTIPDATGRIASTIIGALVLLGGIALNIWTSSKRLHRVDVTALGIKITNPNRGDEVDYVDVRGTIKKPLPEGYNIRVFRLYPGTDRITPIGGKAKINHSEGCWEADRCYAGSKSGEIRSMAAFLVGPSGTALIEYHNEASKVHRKTMDELHNASGKEGEYLPAIGMQTTDMYECDRVQIKTK